jgi:L-iditol 2-dehydrogenase
VTGVNGRVMFFGGLPEGRSKVPLDTNLIHYKQVTVTGTSRQSLSQYRATLGLIAARRLVVKDLVTLSTPLDGIRASFEQVMQGKGLKNVIEFP